MSSLLNKINRLHISKVFKLKCKYRRSNKKFISMCNPWLLAPITALSGFTLGSTYYNVDNDTNSNSNFVIADNRRTTRRRERHEYNEAICIAAKNRNYERVEELLSSPLSNPDARSKYGWCALHIAVVNDDIKMVKLLLDNGADINMEDLTNPYIGNIRKQLFSDKIHVNAPTQGWTALHFAVAFFNVDIIKLLVGKYGADAYNKYDKRGYCPADYLDSSIPKAAEILDILDMETKKYAIIKEKIDRENRLKYPIEKELKKYIVGQLLPINSVSSAIRRKLNGWYDPQHSNLVFLFLGSSGVGKTELAKSLSKILYKTDKLHGEDSPFIRVDMSEFQHKHEVSKFIGAPPGYVGHESGGQLTKQLSKHPNAIVLLDEVEKAHPDVLTICLQLFDEGRITDGKGETVECKDAIFIMTSNLAQTEIGDEAENLRKDVLRQCAEDNGDNVLDDGVTLSRQFIEDTIQPILKNHFKRDEFLGRINEILYFLPFNDKELKQLTVKELNKWNEISKDKHDIEMAWTDSAVDLLKDGYNFRYGARSIQHEVEKRIINQIAKIHENGKISNGSKVKIVGDVNNGTIRIEYDNTNMSQFDDNKHVHALDEKDKKSWFW